MALPKIKNLTELKKDATNIITNANKGQSIMITHKSGDVFLVPRHEYELYLEQKEIDLAYLEAEADLKNGFVGHDTNEVFATLYKKYGFLNESKTVKSRKKRS